MRRTANVIWIATLVALFSLYGRTAQAVSITVTGAANYHAGVFNCAGTNPVQAYINCTNDSHLDDVSITGEDAEFAKSFNAWNAMNAAGSKWTLVDGGTIPGLALTVSTFRTFATPSVGGVEIQVDWTADPEINKDDYKWSQGLYDNYMLDGSIVPPFYEMDVRAAAGCNNANLLTQCPPLYPFQYADRKFYDKPQAPWPNSFFEARAFLSKADFTTRTLTIYDGVNYGFQLNAELVPEPATLMLMLPGILWIAVVARRRMVAWRVS